MGIYGLGLLFVQIPSLCLMVYRHKSATNFMKDLASRLANRVQLTTDGFHSYIEAVEESSGDDIDYEMLIKIFGKDREGEKRYSPAKCIGIKKETINGNPAKRHTSTSFIERSNLTLRVTPAMEAKISDHVWEIEEILELLNEKSN